MSCSCLSAIAMKPSDKEKEQEVSNGLFRWSVVVCIALLIFVSGFSFGVWLLMRRIAHSEEAIQKLREKYRHDETVNENSHASHRARRDSTHSLTFDEVRNVVNKQLRSVTPSQVCATPDRVCVFGRGGIKGRDGCEGEKGFKGEPGGFGRTPYFAPKGHVGDPGFDGPRGEAGMPGPKGNKGIKGEVGKDGITGGNPVSGSAPTVYVSPSNLTVMENATATIECFAFGEPTPYVVWGKQGEGGLQSCFGKVVIKQARLQNAGKYICKAFNSHGSAEATTELKVHGD